MREKELHNIRNALADYMWSEGCSCCRTEPEHSQAAKRLAKILKVPRYKGGSGYNFAKYRTKQTPDGERK